MYRAGEEKPALLRFAISCKILQSPSFSTLLYLYVLNAMLPGDFEVSLTMLLSPVSLVVSLSVQYYFHPFSLPYLQLFVQCSMLLLPAYLLNL